MPPTIRFVFDSFALLAYLRNEPGRPRVENLIEQAREAQVELHMSLLNLGEVLYQLFKKGELDELDEFRLDWRRLPIYFRPGGEQEVLAAADIKGGYPVAYADAFAIALAQELDCPVLTGDPEFLTVQGLIEVEWLPRSSTAAGTIPPSPGP